jgi:hypothetical protein
MKHKHADLIHAWADGAQIQWLSVICAQWEDIDMNGKEWYEHYKYRIKPEPKPDVVKYLICGLKSWVEVDDQVGHECIKIVVDGKGRLKSAEVLK